MKVFHHQGYFILWIIISIQTQAIANQGLIFVPQQLKLEIQQGQILQRAVSLLSVNADVSYTVQKDDEVNWIKIINPNGKTKPFIAQITLRIDASQLTPGTYQTTLSATSSQGGLASLKLELIVSNPPLKILYMYGEIDVSGRTPQDIQYSGIPFEQMRLDDTNPKGMSKFRQGIEELGFKMDQFWDLSVTLTDDFLKSYQLIILSSNQKLWSNEEARAVSRWVRRGGGIIAFTDANFGGYWENVGRDNERGRDSDNLLTAQFGLFFLTDQGGQRGINLIKEWTTPHFINTAISKKTRLSFEGQGCSPIRILRDWPGKMPRDTAYQLAPFQNSGTSGAITINDPDLGENIQNDALDCALAAAEIGQGRILGIFDRNTFWNQSTGTDITKADNFTLAQNMVLWATRKTKLKRFVKITGELKKWHKITLTFEGPETSEQDSINPFLDYRLNVTFSNGKKTFLVPGYYAADGEAAETGASTGNKWRVHFVPYETGNWSYKASFRSGKNIAITDDENAGISDYFDGEEGAFQVAQSNKIGRDLRGKGFLEYVGHHYLRFQNGDWFLKAGADSPETLLAYADFDNTYPTKVRSDSNNLLKTWKAHIEDWQNGDPTWQGEKGKGLIGAINYLSEKGNNAFSFLTYNAGGDGTNVWPFVNPENPLQYDCSKLDQWEIIFEHADKKGMFLHFKTQEEENDNHSTWGLDGGDLGIERKLYYRELIARFGHHLALNWNIGEENTQTRTQQQEMIAYFQKHDPYQHPIVIHTYPVAPFNTEIYEGLIGSQSQLTGPSLQLSFNRIHAFTLNWVKRSAEEGREWVVTSDEQNPPLIGVAPDTGWEGFNTQTNPTQKNIRQNVLWGNLMAGGGGVEYYFGYNLPENDLNAENWRSRDNMWDYNKYALEFFVDNHIPFWEMTNQNELIGNLDANNQKYCLAKPDSIYVIYLAQGGTTELRLNPDKDIIYEIFWYNPRTGGALQQGEITTIQAKDTVTVGPPPSEPAEDWVALLINPGSALGIENDLAGQHPHFKEEWFQAFPNPARDYVQVSYTGPSSADLSYVKSALYTSEGRKLMSSFFSKQGENWLSEFDLRGLPRGTYYMVIDCGDLKVRKIVLADF